MSLVFLQRKFCMFKLLQNLIYIFHFINTIFAFFPIQVTTNTRLETLHILLFPLFVFTWRTSNCTAVHDTVPTCWTLTNNNYIICVFNDTCSCCINTTATPAACSVQVLMRPCCMMTDGEAWKYNAVKESCRETEL